MTNYETKIKYAAASPEDAKRLATALQNAVNTIAYADIVKLLEAANKKPQIVKTALKFL